MALSENDPELAIPHLLSNYMSMNPTPTEVYFGDILTLRRQLLSEGVCKTHIFQSMVRTRRINLPEYMDTYWRGLDWEVLMQDAGQMMLYKPGSKQSKPNAVWPIFSAEHHTMADLINFCKYPWGERDDLREKADPADWYFPPRKSQEHVVWIANTGLLHTKQGLKVNMKFHEWVEVLEELKQEYGVKFGLANSASLRAMFSGAFDMATFSTADRNRRGEAVFPNGTTASPKAKPELFEKCKPLITAIGYLPSKVESDFQELALFNINSVQYASVNWGNEVSSMRVRHGGSTKKKVDVQPDKPDAEVAGVRTIKKAFPAPPRVPTR